jgi:C1A family cysteine protease
MSAPVADGLRARAVQRYGWVPDVPDNRDLLFSAPTAVMAALPAQTDLRPGCPAVYDQGQLGSCTANAIAAAFEFDQKKQQLTDFMPSRLFIYYNERAIEGTVESDSGAMIRDGMKTLNKIGVCPEGEWPYQIANFRDKPTDQCYTDAKAHQSLVYRAVLQDVHQLQGCLASGYPVVFGFSVYESFESPDVARTGVVPLPKQGEKQLGGHAVLAVGYTDSDQTFWVRNSWGDGWGQAGYCKMPYAYLTSSGLASDFWALYTVEQ